MLRPIFTGTFHKTSDALIRGAWNQIFPASLYRHTIRIIWDIFHDNLYLPTEQLRGPSNSANGTINTLGNKLSSSWTHVTLTKFRPFNLHPTSRAFSGVRKHKTV